MRYSSFGPTAAVCSGCLSPRRACGEGGGESRDGGVAEEVLRCLISFTLRLFIECFSQDGIFRLLRQLLTNPGRILPLYGYGSCFFDTASVFFRRMSVSVRTRLVILLLYQ